MEKNFTNNNSNIPMNDNVDGFLIKAKSMTARVLNIKPEEVYVVWFSKTLMNWKACTSSVYADGKYVEVTHNGHKNETYIDVYKKESNTCIKGEN